MGPFLSTLFTNASLHPALLPCATLHGSHSTRQLCFHQQIWARQWPGPLQRRSSPWPEPPRPRVLPLRTRRLCFLSFSILWQILARTDARAAKCIVLSQTELSACFCPPPTPLAPCTHTNTSTGLGAGEQEGEEAGTALGVDGQCQVDSWTDRSSGPKSPPISSLAPRSPPTPHPSHVVPRSGHEVAL